MSPPRLVLVLSENWTLTSPRDLRALVRIAVEAEAAGVDAVMLSEHVVLGPASGAGGIMGNPRDYAAPGNRTPPRPGPTRSCSRPPSPRPLRTCASRWPR